MWMIYKDGPSCFPTGRLMGMNGVEHLRATPLGYEVEVDVPEIEV
jgi:hypothetical protein